MKKVLRIEWGKLKFRMEIRVGFRVVCENWFIIGVRNSLGVLGDGKK